MVIPISLDSGTACTFHPFYKSETSPAPWFSSPLSTLTSGHWYHTASLESTLRLASSPRSFLARLQPKWAAWRAPHTLHISHKHYQQGRRVSISQSACTASLLLWYGIFILKGKKKSSQSFLENLNKRFLEEKKTFFPLKMIHFYHTLLWFYKHQIKS